MRTWAAAVAGQPAGFEQGDRPRGDRDVRPGCRVVPPGRPLSVHPGKSKPIVDPSEIQACLSDSVKARKIVIGDGIGDGILNRPVEGSAEGEEEHGLLPLVQHHRQ